MFGSISLLQANATHVVVCCSQCCIVSQAQLTDSALHGRPYRCCFDDFGCPLVLKR
jgi:hypothetical protein